MIDRYVLRARWRRFAHRVAEGGADLWGSAIMPLWRGVARRNRDRFVGTYVAVMGSVGKSTATILAGEMLSRQRSVELGAFDNAERHVLRFLRHLDHSVDILIQELSEFPLGTIGSVSRATAIDAAAVTAIGLDHRTSFRTNEAIAEEMASLLRALPPEGFACLNADVAAVAALAASCKCRVVLFGRSASAELRAENLSARSGRLAFDLVVFGQRRHVTTCFVGTLMLPSILAALSIVHALHLDLDDAVEALAGMEPQRRRMGVFSGTDQHTYVADVFKASYWSTMLFIEDIPNMGEGPRIFVLGEVSDIANDTSRMYRKIIRAAASRCDLVIGMGGHAASAAEKVARLEPGLRVVAARNPGDVTAILRDRPPSLVLLKGKRMRLLPALRNNPLWRRPAGPGSRDVHPMER